MPIVLLLVIVVGLVTTVALERQGAQARAVRRHVDAVRSHHEMLGIQDVVNAWLRGVGSGRPVLEALGEQGRAFDLDLGNGVTLTMYVHDAQGRVLGSAVGLREEDAMNAADVLRELMILVPTPEELAQRRSSRPVRRHEDWPEREAMVRQSGPVSISVLSAPEPVLLAAVIATTGRTDRNADELVERIISARARGALASQELASIMGDARLQPDERSALSRLLTTEPMLYWAEVIVREEGLRGRESRFVGEFLVPTRSNSTMNPYEQSTPFVSWRRLDEGEPWPMMLLEPELTR